MNLEGIKKLSSKDKEEITTLYLHQNGLKTIPKEVFELANLQTLYISENDIKEISDEIGNLSKLRYINVSENQLSSLPHAFTRLTNLKKLFINNNNFREFPEIVSLIPNLEILSLSSNKINKLPEQITGFKNLEELFLENCNISRLPKSFAFIPYLKTIGLKGNILTNVPIEIVHSGIPALRNYFSSIDEAKKTYKVYEAKLLIVGEGEVGKTCIMEKLMNVNKDVRSISYSTEGIDIRKWYVDTKKYKNFRVNIWDFGGQEIYHATHQFFLTKRSLYVLVWTARKDDNLTFDYWLNVIKLLSDDAPVIILLNKIDERIKMIDELAISEKFNNVVSFHKISALNGTGMDALTDIIKNEVEKLPHIGDTLPKAWVDIRGKLEKLDKNHISLTEYKNICKEFDLTENQAMYLSKYFHDLGVILHFQDNLILNDIVFLKPEWATNAVYKIIDTKQIQANYGRFKSSDLSTIWSSYDEDEYKYLIELMKKFELCFQIEQEIKKNEAITRKKTAKKTKPIEIHYIAPELLSETRPESFHKWEIKSKESERENHSVYFEYHYDFMPTGIITRLIVRLNDMRYKSNYWKNGLVIRKIEQYTAEITDASIISMPFERKIKIHIAGSEVSQVLAIIRREIEYIHKTMNNPTYRELIPCKCNICIKSSETSMFNYSDLKIQMDCGEDSIFCTKGRNRVKISLLLEGISKPKTATNNSNPKNVYINNSDVVFKDS